MELLLPTPLTEIYDALWQTRGIQVLVKRDDMIHPDVSGNKWRKLKYIIEYLQKQKIRRIASYGGVYSNHLRALSVVCNSLDIELTCMIRGEDVENENLQFLRYQGAELIFLDRNLYKRITQDGDSSLQSSFIGKDVFVIPEGGNHPLAWQGCSDMVKEIDIHFDYIFTAVGTGATLTGISRALQENQQVLGISALKGDDRLSISIKEHTIPNFTLDFKYHFGGYARTTPELLDFIHKFQQRHNIALDYVYTGKMFFAMYKYIENGFFEEGTTIIALHTGGVSNASVV